MIDKTSIAGRLKTSFFGKYLYHFPEIESTNTYAKKLAQEGAPEGTVVISEFQTGGKGRMGRSWQSSPGENILMSLILRPRLEIESVQCITLATATIIMTSIERYYRRKKINGPQMNVKWPNDIYIGEKKVAGILTESSLQDKKIEYLVVGIGINVNQNLSDFDEDLSLTATSLRSESGHEIKLEEMIATIINEFERVYIRLESSNYRNVVREWKKYCRQFGKRVSIETPVCVETGIIKDINEAGQILYETDRGKQKVLVTGTIRK